jgi:hypothetical protein
MLRFAKLSLFILCILLGLLLTACGQNERFPVYDGVVEQLNDREIVQYNLAPPYFSDKLQRITGDYYIVTGSVDTVSRWYQNLVTDQQLNYVDSYIRPDYHILLYDFPLNFNQKGEVNIIRIDENSSLLVLYQSIDVNNQITGNSNWFERTWGWLTGISGPTTFDALFELILAQITPIQVFYEHVYLKPILNLYIILRSLLPWYFLWIIILHSFIVAFCYDAITNPIKRIIINLLPKSTSSHDDNQPISSKITSIILVLTKLFLSFFFGGLIALAIWQSLSAFFDVSPAGRALITDNHYAWIPAHMIQLSLIPPEGELFGTPFNKPNIILIPICIFVITFLNYMLNMYITSTMSMMISDGTIPRSVFSNESLFLMTVLDEQDPLASINDAITESLKSAALLAFMPIGVAFYIVFEKIQSLYQTIMYTSLLTIVQARNHVWYNVLLFVRKSITGAIILGFIWLGYSTFTQSYDAFRQTVISTNTMELNPPTVVLIQIATSTPETTEQEPTATPTYGKVTAKSLRVRAQPTTQSTTLAGLQQDEQLRIIGISPDNLWLFVEYENEKYGWVSLNYVTVDDASQFATIDEQGAQEYMDVQP